MENSSSLRIQIQERPKHVGQWMLLSFQHVFAMFGATVLVPLLTGLNVGVALVASGVGTLIYILSTRAKVPVYLGSSFAYISAIVAASAAGGFESAYVGLMAVGIIYAVVATIIRFTGNNWIVHLLPPVVIGPAIIIIGLTLAPVAIGSAGFDGAAGWQTPVVAIITFLTVIAVGLLTKGFFKIVTFIIAISVGYIFAAIFGLISIYNVFCAVTLFVFIMVIIFIFAD